ncbi:CHASE2 domain-containing protein [Herbaspirillum sp. RV1423]|uniref:CHASE2 domain-containing protein n=1 Tax=Herbaspirillum sp. RV1423 TaxID=1443993 RepID=UPI00054D0959|nr:CHASE2 domain-containing protein [Herbaspirillum sp. RV1423]
MISQPAGEPGRSRWSRTRRRVSLRNEWLALFVITLAAAFLLVGGDSLRVPDRLIYDHLMSTLERPAPDNIVIVAIDDKSIAELGRWPWKRGTHAQLLNILSNGAPRAIGFDVILTEGDAAAASGDHALALAIARNRHVVLPILTTRTETGLAPLLPYADFATAAAGLAHIQLNFSGDGIVRSAYLYETLGGREWKTLALSLLEDADRLRDSTRPLPPRSGHSSVAGTPQIAHRDLLVIPFYGPPGHFTRVSYIDVLRGALPAHFFRDKYVLVGAAASGLGDVFPVPQANRQGLMSGVELHANILAALQEGRSISAAPRPARIAFAALPALLVLIGFMYLSPRHALALTGVLTVLAGALCYGLLQYDIWLAPSAALLLLWLIYPLWSWRRLEVALRYLDEETGRLASSTPFAATAARPEQRRLLDFFERRIDAARIATRRMLDLHQFVSDNLNSMPDANVVIDCNGVVMLFNRKARELFMSLHIAPARGQDVQLLLAPLLPIDAALAGAPWRQLLTSPAQNGGDSDDRAYDADGIEATDPLQRMFLIRSTPSRQANGDMLGWIISLADVTALRATLRLRDESLNFISHDMRAPQSAILATLELQRSGQIVLDQEILFRRIEKSVHSTLSLADEFILLARAESKSYQPEELDFRSLLADATDEMWALANERQVRLDITTAGDDASYWVCGDRPMLVRALCNLISNAIKYGPRDAVVECRLSVDHRATPPQLVCAIHDRGPGLTETDLDQLFTPFYRATGSTQPGAGLGLTFVKTVVEHHGGNVGAANADGGGACFIVRLPCAPE